MSLGILRRLETRALLLIAGLSGAVWAFFSIAGEVGEGETHAIDQRILLSLRNPADLNDPIGPRTFEEAMRDMTALGGFTVVTLVTVVAALMFLFHKRWRHALVFVSTILLAELSSEWAKGFYGRPRPDLVSHGSYVYSASFPSGHSTLSAATYLTLAVLIAGQETDRATKSLVFGLAIILVAMIGASRVYLGVHWPTDVLAGWCLGAAWATAAWIAVRRIGGATREAPAGEGGRG